LQITRQAVAKHLVALQNAGLVEPRREGRETRYTLTPAPLMDAMDWMAEVGAAWDGRLARLLERARG
jgi:DNA-binding transcriptional ArsR family regulator